MTGLLRLLREHPDAVEADLARYYQLDWRDRWRTDGAGRPLLGLRRLAVLVRHLPSDSATVTAVTGEEGWTRDQVLLTDLWSAWAGKEHPAIADARRRHRRPLTAERLERLRSARARARERRRQIESGELT